jgi:chromosome segregation ATPase
MGVFERMASQIREEMSRAKDRAHIKGVAVEADVYADPGLLGRLMKETGYLKPASSRASFNRRVEVECERVRRTAAERRQQREQTVHRLAALREMEDALKAELEAVSPTGGETEKIVERVSHLLARLQAVHYLTAIVPPVGDGEALEELTDETEAVAKIKADALANHESWIKRLSEELKRLKAEVEALPGEQAEALLLCPRYARPALRRDIEAVMYALDKAEAIY